MRGDFIVHRSDSNVENITNFDKPAAETNELDYSYSGQPPNSGGKNKKTKRKKSNLRKTKRSHRKRK